MHKLWPSDTSTYDYNEFFDQALRNSELSDKQTPAETIGLLKAYLFGWGLYQISLSIDHLADTIANKEGGA